MSDPKPLGINLASLAARKSEMDIPFVHPACPGARVYVTREDVRAMIQGGEEFQREGTDVPPEGRGHARLRCGRPVESKVGVAGNVVYYGLCSSCSKVEENNRKELRRLADKAKGKRQEGDE
jgi:hypothetical protein